MASPVPQFIFECTDCGFQHTKRSVFHNHLRVQNHHQYVTHKLLDRDDQEDLDYYDAYLRQLPPDARCKEMLCASMFGFDALTMARAFRFFQSEQSQFGHLVSGGSESGIQITDVTEEENNSVAVQHAAQGSSDSVDMSWLEGTNAVTSQKQKHEEEKKIVKSPKKKRSRPNRSRRRDESVESCRSQSYNRQQYDVRPKETKKSSQEKEQKQTEKFTKNEQSRSSRSHRRDVSVEAGHRQSSDQKQPDVRPKVTKEQSAVHLLTKQKTAISPSKKSNQTAQNVPVPALQGELKGESKTEPSQLESLPKNDRLELRHHQSDKHNEKRIKKDMKNNQAEQKVNRKTVEIEGNFSDGKAFPLTGTHNYKIACSACLDQTKVACKFTYKEKLKHVCKEDKLVVQAKNNNQDWVEIRQRLSYLGSRGAYKMCSSLINKKNCPRDDTCKFAHCEEELKLWTFESHERFIIWEFILQHRLTHEKHFTIKYLQEHHPGDIRFVCKACFNSKPPRINPLSERSSCPVSGSHHGNQNRLLLHTSVSGQHNPIAKRPDEKYHHICPNKFCNQKLVLGGNCSRAHSMVEQNIRMHQRDKRIQNQEILVNNWKKPKDRQNVNPTRKINSPFHIWFVCKCCWGSQPRAIAEIPCPKHATLSGMHLLYPKDKRQKPVPIRQLPSIKIPVGGFGLCKHMLERNRCDREEKHPGSCTYAHSSDEKDVWQWMTSNKVHSLDDIVQQRPSVNNEEGQQILQPTRLANCKKRNIVAPVNSFPMSSHLYCRFCNVECNSQRQMDLHCASPKHRNNIVSDADHEWSYRRPPFIRPGGRFKLCPKKDDCEYADRSDDYNFCTFAHCEEELDEWIERLKLRRQKKDIAKEENLYSYTDSLIVEYEATEEAITVMTDYIDGVEVKSSSLNQTLWDKSECVSWTFKIQCRNTRALDRVALLHHQCRDKFAIELTDASAQNKEQVVDGHQFKLMEAAPQSGFNHYQVTVKFMADTYGSFRQTVVFDFGSRPVLVQRLLVDVRKYQHQMEIQETRTSLDFDRWTKENTPIHQYHDSGLNEFDKRLLSRYKTPSVEDNIIHSESHKKLPVLQRGNYVHKMHRMLNIEELSRAKLIARYNITTDVEVREYFSGPGINGFIKAQRQGELVGSVPLLDSISKDTKHGRLICESCEKVLFKKIGTNDVNESPVYEAPVLKKDQDTVYIVLSERCIQEMDLKDEMSFKAEVQFQMDRLPLCKMHFAVDRMKEMDNLDRIFPTGDKLMPELPHSEIEPSTTHLNEGQMKLIMHILPRRESPPPVVLYGPFGTGKTETIAQASILLCSVHLQRRSKKFKILICTQTNSASDLYVEKYFDKFVQDKPNVKVLRIYYVERHISTVPEIVRKYCTMNESGNSFRIPELKEFQEAHIIITTLSTSIALTELQGLRGIFSHIFVDEAGQALECESIMPLALADSKTCIVLTGDHMQIKPEVYSKESEVQVFQRSLLERLFESYTQHERQMDIRSPFKLLLNMNYRTKPEILKFIATIFYDGPEALIPKSTVPEVEAFRPMNFYVAQGQNILNVDSKTYMNQAEADEIAEMILYLYGNWPEQWGERKQEDICVLAGSDGQMRLIRRTLRRCGMGSVYVQSVISIQGREFRVIFISTVWSDLTRSVMTEDHNLGFLSDRKLLNSVLTRVQSLVAVVGNPVTLLRFGSCSTIWKRYMEECFKMESFFPQTLTMENLMSEVESVDLSYSAEEGSSDDEDWDVKPDEILKQLALESYRLQNRKQKEELPAKNGELPLIKVNYTIHEEDDQAVLRLQQVHTKGKHDTASFIKSGEDESDTDDVYDTDEDEADVTEDIMNKLKAQPHKYKECILHIPNLQNIYAVVKDPHSQIKKVNIGSRARCGHAFPNDEVVVEIIDQYDEERKQSHQETEDEVHGSVVGILKRAFNLRFRKFVCRVETKGNKLMIPIEQIYPIMCPLTTDENKGKRIISVYSLKNKKIKFVREEYLETAVKAQKLFIVRFVKWEEGFHFPLCIVVGTLSPGLSMKHGMDILDIQYSVPKRFKDDTSTEVRNIFDQIQPGDRLDLRGDLIFTIDPQNSEDLDDALSIKKLPNGQYQIGIHISDVSHWVDKDKCIDKEARGRGVSFYPCEKPPVPMLPERLSGNLCSLLRDKDRYTVSVFITIEDITHPIVLDHTERLTVINSKHQLTYQEAECILDKSPGDQPDQELYIALSWLNSVARFWHKERLGTAAAYPALDIADADSPKAHILVQEMMIHANRHIGNLLIRHYPGCVPLRIQQPPDENELQEWRENYQQEAKNCLILKQPFLEKGVVCQCSGACRCIPEISNQDKVSILKDSWDEILHHVASNQSDEKAIQYLTDPRHLPEVVNAVTMFRKLQENAVYVCGNNTDIGMYHYSLQMEAYTHFTSPIRRYIDLVVHRLLKAVLNKEPCPYNSSEISSICTDCTNTSRRAKQYEHATQMLHLAVLLNQQPVSLQPVVSNIKTDQINFRYWDAHASLASCRELPMSILRPHKQPRDDANTGSVDIVMKERIYDPQGCETSTSDDNSRFESRTQILNPARFIVTLEQSTWQSILMAAANGDVHMVTQECIAAHLERESEKVPNETLSSEKRDITYQSQHCDFSLKIGHSSVMQVQLNAELYRGILRPAIQLVNFAPDYDICVQHRKNPVDCFNKASSPKPLTTNPNIQEYQQYWLFLNNIEGAYSTIKDGERILIRNVSIKWEVNERNTIGSFQLSSKFCEERNMISLWSSGYMCIRYSGTSQCIDDGIHKVVKVNREHIINWVGHCVVKSCEKGEMEEDHTNIGQTDKEENRSLDIKIELIKNATALPLPPSLYTEDISGFKAVVEFMPKGIPMSREEGAITSLNKGTDLAKQIAISPRPHVIIPENKLGKLQEFLKHEMAKMQRLNPSQREAVKKALTQSFTLLWGPPGTGKTYTGVYISKLFFHYNMTHPEYDGDGNRSQVMYCGPSNKSVDVVAAFLMKQIPSCTNHVVRVYSADIEHQDYPNAFDAVEIRPRKSYVQDKSIRSIALHHIIRDPEKCEHATFIIEYDKMLKKIRQAHAEYKSGYRGKPKSDWLLNDNGKAKMNLSSEERKAYGALIKEAKIEVLRKYDIILTTCHSSSSPTVSRGTFIKQLIIDECGMCKEPESMVPIVSTKAEQIILIGDHKQLRPIVTNSRAKELGLEKSLFERLSGQEATHMLNIQYRMPQAIAEFPSQQFYNDKLICGVPHVQNAPSRLDIWPGGRNKPIVFVHVVGTEKSLAVSTSEGNEQSKSNEEEVIKARQAAFHLVKNCGVQPKDVIILSQYNAQVSELEKTLPQHALGDVNVSTVIKAQGSEWDYVILSTVRSLPKHQIEPKPSQSWSKKNLGFITDEHQINVALTRAKKGLIIIGNSNLLVCDKMWRKLLQYYKKEGALVQAVSFPPKHS